MSQRPPRRHSAVREERREVTDAGSFRADVREAIPQRVFVSIPISIYLHLNPLCGSREKLRLHKEHLTVKKVFQLGGTARCRRTVFDRTRNVHRLLLLLALPPASSLPPSLPLTASFLPSSSSHPYEGQRSAHLRQDKEGGSGQSGRSGGSGQARGRGLVTDAAVIMARVTECRHVAA